MDEPSFPFKIDITYINIQDDQLPISKLEYKYSDKITFIITKNEIWDKNLFGVKINF